MPLRSKNVCGGRNFGGHWALEVYLIRCPRYLDSFCCVLLSNLHFCYQRNILPRYILSCFSTEVMSVPPGVDLSHVPALTPPPGVKPNFNNPESRAHATIIANGITTGVMLAFVVTRVYTKLAITKSFAWEDCKDPYRSQPREKRVLTITIQMRVSLVPYWQRATWG